MIKILLKSKNNKNKNNIYMLINVTIPTKIFKND